MGEVYIDTETTGLDPTKHAIWEVGLITAKGDEKSWMVELTNQELADADPFALQIGGFHKRHPQGFMVEVPVNQSPRVGDAGVSRGLPESGGSRGSSETDLGPSSGGCGREL